MFFTLTCSARSENFSKYLKHIFIVIFDCIATDLSFLSKIAIEDGSFDMFFIVQI